MISLGVDTSHNDDNTEQKTNGNVMCTILFHFHIYDHQENISQVILFFQYCLFMHLETLLLCILYCGSHYELTLAPLLNFSRQNFWPWHQSLYYFYQVELSRLIVIHSCRGLPRSTVH